MPRSAAPRLLLACLAALACAPASARAAELSVRIEGLRNAQGIVSVCVTAKADAFPGCDGDPAARRQSVRASEAARPVVFQNLAPGTYAVAALHDENADGRLDTNVLGIPTEGIGVSNDALPAFSAPRFRDAAVRLERSGSLSVRVRYR